MARGTKGKKWSPEQLAKFRETMAAKRAEKLTNGTGRKALPNKSQSGELDMARLRLDTVNRLVKLIERILEAENA